MSVEADGMECQGKGIENQGQDGKGEGGCVPNGATLERRERAAAAVERTYP